MSLLVKMTLATAFTVAFVATAGADESCHYKGTVYSDGSVACQAGTKFECDDGEWESLSIACADKTLPKSCELNGTTYSSGSASCQAGTQYRCDDGSWKSLAVACPPDVVAVPRNVPRTCMMEGGATVSSASTVCRHGTMYACEDGEWRNLGTPCR